MSRSNESARSSEWNGSNDVNIPGVQEALPRRLPARSQRRELDERTFERLQAAGSSMQRGCPVVLIDRSVDLGREFHLPNLPQHPIFSMTVAKRAAEIALSFDAFVSENPQPLARPLMLRPKGGPVRPGDLAEAISDLSRSYDDAVKRLVTPQYIAPLCSTLHLRWMPELGRFDIHLHVLWNVFAEDLKTIRRILNEQFATVWISEETARCAGAVINYDTCGILDHNALQTLPDAALLAVASLTKVRFHRPAGEFAAYRSRLKEEGLRLRRGPFGIKAVPIRRRLKMGPGEGREDNGGTFRGRRVIRIAGRVRNCEVHVFPRPSVCENPPQAEAPDIRTGVHPDSNLPVTPALITKSTASDDPVGTDRSLNNGSEIVLSEPPAHGVLPTMRAFRKRTCEFLLRSGREAVLAVASMFRTITAFLITGVVVIATKIRSVLCNAGRDLIGSRSRDFGLTRFLNGKANNGRNQHFGSIETTGATPECNLNGGSKRPAE